MKKGNRSEQSALANNVSSKDEDFVRFLGLLGREVLLFGWTRYRGGLDVKNNLTGEKSVYYCTNDQEEIMVHVGPYLPSNESDPKFVHGFKGACANICKD